MADNTPTVSCDLVCDLLVVYASGEASEETVRFIETHLPDCPECQEAYEAARRGEDLLDALEPVEKPLNIDGRKILLRFQRIFFGLLILLLLVTVLSIAVVERLVIGQILGIPLPQLYVLGGPGGGMAWAAAGLGLLAVYAGFQFWRETRAGDAGSTYLALLGASLLFAAGLVAYRFMVQGGLSGTLIAGILTFSAYIFLLRWRSRRERAPFSAEVLMSVEAAVPLFFLVLATLTLTSAVGVLNAVPAMILLVVALLFTLIQLGELPYISLVTIAALLVGGVMLLVNAAGGFFGLLDLTLQWPADLGHPRQALVIDLASLGFETGESESIAELDGVQLAAGAAGTRTRYLRGGEQPAFITVIRFENDRQAADFMRTWERRVDRGFYAVHLELSDAGFDSPDGWAQHPLNWDLELPGVWFGQQGQIVRAYNEAALAAYNAWQVDEWVTIVEVHGGVAQALKQSRQIRELVSAAYR